MNRILDFTASQEETVVARLLVLVHQAVDEHFPSAEQPNRQFTKTVFSGEGEKTAMVAAAGSEEDSAFGSEEQTSPMQASAPETPLDEVQARERAAAHPTRSTAPLRGNTRPSTLAASQSPTRADERTKPTRLESDIEAMRATNRVDWITIALVIGLVVGLGVFVYAAYLIS